MENFNKLNLRDGDIITEDKLAIIDSNTEKYNANKTEILNTLDSHTSQLNDKANLEDEQLLKGVLYSSSSKVDNFRINSDKIYYQAVVKNPISVTYSNMPIGLKINFEKGECPSIDYLVVKKVGGSTLSFQWEEEVHPNPFIADSENLATYIDGSLKGGTIWIMDTIDVNSANTYIIELHSIGQGNSFNTNITYAEDTSNPNAPKEAFTTSNAFLKFDYITGGYQLKEYTINGKSFNNAGDLLFMPFIKKSDLSTLDVLNTASQWNLSKSYTGTGVIFYDYIIEATYTNNVSVKITTKYRIFSNGLVKILCTFKALDNLPAGLIQGFGGKSKTLDSADRVLTINANASANYKSVLSDGSASITYQVQNVSLSNSLLSSTEGYNCLIESLSATGSQGLQTYWTSSATKTLAKNSMFYIRAYLVPNDDSNFSAMNLVTAHTTKSNLNTLKQRYLALCKKFADHMHGYNFGGYFTGLESYENMAYTKLNNIIKETTNIDSLPAYLSALTTKYGDCTLATTWETKWQSGQGYGIEYIGRDTAPIMFFRELCIQNNKSSSLATIESIIHALADFYVWLENFSGGSGQIMLQSYSHDTLNSEATAMKALNNSLSITSDSTRQSCYDRIKTRFESSMQFKNILPYSQDTPIWWQGLFHYHCFAIFEYLDSVSNPSLDIASYINTTISPSGKINEIGFEYTPARFGFIHTSMYASYIMYKYNTISSIESACKLLENVLSKCFPTGGHQFPLDGWTNVNNGSIDQIIETQVAYQPLMEIIFNS